MSDNPYTISKFMDLLILSLVMKGILELDILSESVWYKKDRRGLTAVHKYAERAVENPHPSREEDDPWFHFLVHARNVLEPGRYGTFMNLRAELINKTSTLVNILHPHDGSYHFHNDRALAQSILRTGHPLLAQYAEEISAIFVVQRNVTSPEIA